jgi:hypothetical protein
MEEADMQDQLGGNTNMTRWALGAIAAALTFALVISLSSGPARAQDPCSGDPIYCIPTPTPTPTGTPFSNQGPSSPPQQPNHPSPGPKLLSPFPTVRTAGSFSGSRTTFTRFTVKAPRGTKVAASCKQSRCRYAKKLKTAKTVHLRKLERTFKAGTRIRLRLTKPDLIGKFVEIRIRRNKRPLRSDRCLRPGRVKPVSCGAG